MCGIFGYQLKAKDYNIARKLASILLYISQERGREASGISIKTKSINKIIKKDISGSLLTQTKYYQTFFDHLDKNLDLENDFISVIGQCRLITNGRSFIEKFNQPVSYDKLSLIHNGIILNPDEMIDQLLGNEVNKKKKDVSDSFLLCKLINSLKYINNNYYENFLKINNSVKGSYSVAFHDDESENIYLTSNTGSLYYYNDEKIFIFASEKNFLEKKQLNKLVKINKKLIKKININEFLTIQSLNIFKNQHCDLKTDIEKINIRPQIFDFRKNLIRCSKCTLPNTYPYIKFDNNGVCNFCINHRPQVRKNIKVLEEIFDKKRSKNGEPDCLVGLSGGRDSCYMLHILKNQFGMNPIAYTYDWGLTTEISRRNQALLTGKLGIEHIIRSPNVRQKRENIRLNINAWLKNPKLGMVPLFMAGDKDFYQYGRTLRKQLNLDLTIFGTGYLYDQRNFFIGYCGVKDDLANVTARTYAYPFKVKAQLASYYIIQYLLNPRYINLSFFDSIKSFFTTFIFKDDFIYLYEYVNWNEKLIEKTLREEYQWEEYKEYGKNQWRMGDGQTAFTNYIFSRIAGFDEFDDFRSRQVRDGLISRDEALELIKKDHEPKYEVLESFANTVGINLESVLSKINNIDTAY